MTTTDHLQAKPDYYLSKEECLESNKKYINTNPRYRNFNQTVFHAGDVEQFETYRDCSNGEICAPEIDTGGNIYAPEEEKIIDGVYWEGYENIPATSVTNTFRYIFDKFKKGIYAKIQENKLAVFLPFSKVNFENEWGDRIAVDPSKYHTLNDFFQSISKCEGRSFSSSRINQFPRTWYGNNCLVRAEYPTNESDTGVSQFKDMLKTLCSERKIPDVEFFINKRDFPLLKKDLTEPYEHLYDDDSLPLLSHRHEKYSPVLSTVSGDRFADVPVPTQDDWGRVSPGKFFPRDCKSYDHKFDTPWGNKKSTAVFRGSTTGCGLTEKTNMRIRAAAMSGKGEKDKDKIPLLDAGITKWNCRPRKMKGDPHLSALDIKGLGFGLSAPLSPEEQSRYKYILNIDGHSSAFRLSVEMNMGSVILKVDSPYKLWFFDFLVPYKEYIPVRSDLSDLLEKIRWCKAHDAECEAIARNARKFYEKNLSRGGILDYFQILLINLKKQAGIYLYNYESPLNLQIKYELENIDSYFPKETRGLPESFPAPKRTFAFLQGTQWVANYIFHMDGVSKNHSEEKTDLIGEFFPIKNLSSQSVHSRVIVRSFFGAPILVSKEISLKEKLREGIHEAFIGTRGVNLVVKKIPNFVYTYGMIRREENIEIFQEHVPGMLFFDYIKSPHFGVKDYLFILIQICLALEVAQSTCAFVHYDLFPWNIMLQKLGSPATFDYSLGKNRVYRIQTKILPIILDYGKSGIVYRGVHHGFIKPYRVSKIQDVVSILVSSLNIILKEQKVSQEDYYLLLKLSNFVSGTGFSPAPFARSKELKEFLHRTHKFSAMLESDKRELEDRSPYSLVEYILKSFPFDFGISPREYEEYTMNKGNSRQIFDFYFSRGAKEKIESYTDVFLRLKMCTIPQPPNVLYNYFAAQSFYKNLTNVYKDLMNFLASENYTGAQMEKYEALYQNSVNYLKFVYDKKISREPKSLGMRAGPCFDSLAAAPYGKETFLLPGKVKELLELRGELPDLGDYKETFVSLFNNDEKFRLDERARAFYSEDLEDLLGKSTIALRNNYANIKTLETVSRDVYGNDIKNLEENIKENIERCGGGMESALDYLQLYKEIVEDAK